MEQNITSLILETASSKFGIFAVKPFQLLVMQRILEQDKLDYQIRNQIVILPTGTGKSLCFLLPATLCSGITVIVYPLLALMNDQLNKLSKNGINCVCLRGGQTKEQRRQAFETLGTGAKILITNPETLCQKQIVKKLSSYHISLFVCDEAHVISQWGKDFRPSYGKLGEILPSLKPRQILAFTATASEDTILDISSCLFKSKPLVVKGDSDRENILYFAWPSNNRILGVLQILSFCPRPAIVFCPTRHSTYDLCRMTLLSNKGIPVMYYHAGLSKEERENIEQWFLESDNGILFATCAYGMGIDKPNIRTTIHYSLPSSSESFLQESGRAGRDGDTSYSYVITTQEDKMNQNPLFIAFTGDSCRRKCLLKQLGEEKDTCTGCDICLGQALKEPIENKTIINAVKYHPFKYSEPLLRSLLCGNYNVSFVPEQYRLDNNFGKLKGLDEYLVAKAVSSLIGKEKPLHLFKFGVKVPLLFYWKWPKRHSLLKVEWLNLRTENRK